MPSHPSKPETLAGDPGLATAGGTPAPRSFFRSLFSRTQLGSYAEAWAALSLDGIQ
jgi:hypothetical protein